ncbi:hypothetical protein BDK51DRAFT_40527 [Blyttiomyces helicus]|uniref:Uncharacterized protein n=1 Tax=Blyttiomyces helicus TaxID=388810 RepID=A0A4P9WMR0_9FUNG|nr:hypothetical protein BDK51DRAFT_40527 [Blyttiomyces helicus]|eukprot:RKO94359.1 hypothetical protein BDK51DRAFT_40527 [Blyttiomyces helicus]
MPGGSWRNGGILRFLQGIRAWIELQLWDLAELKFIKQHHKAIVQTMLYTLRTHDPLVLRATYTPNILIRPTLEAYYTKGYPHWPRLQAIFKNIFQILTVDGEFIPQNRGNTSNDDFAGCFIFPLFHINEEFLQQGGWVGGIFNLWVAPIPLLIRSFLRSSHPFTRDDKPIPPRPGIGQGCGPAERVMGTIICLLSFLCSSTPFTPMSKSKSSWVWRATNDHARNDV